MDFIKDYWEQNAKMWGVSHTASWGDLYAIRLEIGVIGDRLKDGDTVLDAGCGNGFALLEQSGRHKLARAVGLDFSENMIAAGRTRLEESPSACPIEFQVGDLRSLPFPDGSFDVVYTTRALINLPTVLDQHLALTECLRVAKLGGRVLISEAFWEPLCKLNALRLICGLAPLVEHDFNRYLKKVVLEQFLKDRGVLFEVDDFSSVYYFGTRLVRDLVTSTDTQSANYSEPINEDFYELERRYSGGGVGIQQLYSLQKST